MNEHLLARILETPRLPSLPNVALEVIQLVQQPNLHLEQIAETIQHDPALASKVLKTVNTSFYGQTEQVTRLSHAVVVLGLNSVKTLALGFSLAGQFKDLAPDGFDQAGFWKRSLYTAVAARELARQMGVPHEEEAFLGGLFQDLGVLALHEVQGELYAALTRQANGDHQALLELEQAHLDLDHPTVGAALGKNWRLPEILLAPIRHHETPASAPEEAAGLVRAVALGNLAAAVFLVEDPAPALEQFRQGMVSWTQCEDVRGLLRQLHEQAVEMNRLFELPTGELSSADQILARANEMLLELTLQSQQQTDQLQQQNRQLNEQVNMDSLTGVASRGRFNEAVAEAFEEARNAGEVVSLLFVDADHFKQVNDRHGHAVGDLVLSEVAGMLQEAMPEEALVARYGGEEFAVVLPGVDRKTTARLAEQYRRRVAESAIRPDEHSEPMALTVSVGVATAAGGCFDQAEGLVQAADHGVYAAKKAGRNCVRIFSPAREPAQV